MLGSLQAIHGEESLPRRSHVLRFGQITRISEPINNEECIPWESIRQYRTLGPVMVARGKHIQPLLGPEKAFGQVVRASRKERGVSQEDVSLHAECDRTTVSLIERGLVSPKLDTIVKMCKAISTCPSNVMRRMEKSRYYR